MKKLCLDCGDEIVGRVDKKFCSDQCRNNYNNRQNSDANNMVRNINNMLRKNRRILASLNPDGKTKIHKEQLFQEGFNFNYHTNTFCTNAGKTYYYCYDQGYLPLENDWYALVIRKDYVK